MADVMVRGAADTDVSQVLELLYELGRPRPNSAADEARFAGIIYEYIKDADKGVLVADAGGHQIAGLASVMFLARHNRTGPEMYVPELVVRAGWRGRGIGRMLIYACTDMARARGCHRIRLESGNARSGSHAFYRSMGFEQHALSFELRIS